jgi:hypothetical protein
MNKSRVASALLLGAFASLAAAPALPQLGSTAGSSASVTVGSGPNKGTYNFAPTETCVIAAFGKKPLGLSVVLSSEESSLSVDMPNIDEKHANEIQVVLVIADVKPGQARKNTASVTYEIDTRPDAALEPYQKAERANKGTTGKATTMLMQKGASAMLTFNGETASGVKITGEVNCKKVESEK